MAENEEVKTENKGLSPKARKIINIVVDVVCGIILVFALLLAIFSIKSKTSNYEGYTEIFGKSYLGVQSNSMEGDKSDNFSVGDVIAIKLVDSEGARKFKVGDIITFKFQRTANGKIELNTHRIIEVVGEDGYATAYKTKGDNNPTEDDGTVSIFDVVGVYEGKASGLGYISNFMSTSTGFFVCVVVPTLIVVAIAAANLVIVILKERKEQAAATAEAQSTELDAERERIRAELMAEMGIAPKEEVKTEEPEAAGSQTPPAHEEAQPEEKVEEKAEEPAPSAEEPAQEEEKPAVEKKTAPRSRKKSTK